MKVDLISILQWYFEREGDFHSIQHADVDGLFLVTNPQDTRIMGSKNSTPIWSIRGPNRVPYSVTGTAKYFSWNCFNIQKIQNRIAYSSFFIGLVLIYRTICSLLLWMSNLAPCYRWTFKMAQMEPSLLLSSGLSHRSYNQYFPHVRLVLRRLGALESFLSINQPVFIIHPTSSWSLFLSPPSTTTVKLSAPTSVQWFSS